jgi:hypothetical protein
MTTAKQAFTTIEQAIRKNLRPECKVKVELTKERGKNGEASEIEVKATIEGSDNPFTNATAFEKAIYAEKSEPATKDRKEWFYTGNIDGLKYNLRMYAGKAPTTAA